MLKAKRLLDYTNVFSPNEYENNYKMILKYIQQVKKFRRKKSVVLIVVSTDNLKTLKHIFSKRY